MSFAGLLNQSVTIANAGVRDKYGKPSFGSETEVPARFQKTNQTIITADREREPIHGIVFVASSVTVYPGDKLIHDTLSSSVEYRVMTVDEVVAKSSVHHKELKVQLWSM